MTDLVIGVVGGMGTYATVDFFRRLADAFPGEKEWDRPRMIIDNYCTMPSRVRAILYNERRQELVENLSQSVRNLLRAGANKLIFVCNTSHVFLPEVIEAVPECAPYIVHIIEELAKQVKKTDIRELGLVATEGTIETGIYGRIFERYGMQIHAPQEDQFAMLREFIEAIKQNCLDDACMQRFVEYLDSFPEEAVILGCTELPILYNACIKAGYKTKKLLFDPLQSAIDVLKASV